MYCYFSSVKPYTNDLDLTYAPFNRTRFRGMSSYTWGPNLDLVQHVCSIHFRDLLPRITLGQFVHYSCRQVVSTPSALFTSFTEIICFTSKP